MLAYSPDGEAVAYSNVVTGASDSDDPGIDQWATIVRPDHRGHRLGLAVKCALTRAIQEHFPEAEYVRTQNAETNAPMVAINEAHGVRDPHGRGRVPEAPGLGVNRAATTRTRRAQRRRRTPARAPRRGRRSPR